MGGGKKGDDLSSIPVVNWQVASLFYGVGAALVWVTWLLSLLGCRWFWFTVRARVVLLVAGSLPHRCAASSHAKKKKKKEEEEEEERKKKEKEKEKKKKIEGTGENTTKIRRKIARFSYLFNFTNATHVHVLPCGSKQVLFLTVGVVSFAGSFEATRPEYDHLCNVCPGAGIFNPGSCTFDWSAILGME